MNVNTAGTMQFSISGTPLNSTQQYSCLKYSSSDTGSVLNLKMCVNAVSSLSFQLTHELDITEVELVRIQDCWKSSCPILTSGKKFAQQVSTFSVKLESDQSGKLVFFSYPSLIAKNNFS